MITNAQIAAKLVARNGNVTSAAWSNIRDYTAMLKFLDTLGITARVRRIGRVLTVSLETAVAIIESAAPFDPARFPRVSNSTPHKNGGKLEVARDWYVLGEVVFFRGDSFDMQFISTADPRDFGHLQLRRLTPPPCLYESRAGRWLCSTPGSGVWQEWHA